MDIKVFGRRIAVVALDFDPIDEAGRNWANRGWGAVAAMRTATSITRAHQIVQGRIDAALAPLDLNFSRFEVLALLSFTKSGELPMGKIGDRLQVHAASVTNTIQRLEERGFVQRARHAEDRRTVLARILPAGRRVAEEGAAALAAIDFGLDGMAVASRRQMDEALVAFRATNGDFS